MSEEALGCSTTKPIDTMNRLSDRAAKRKRSQPPKTYSIYVIELDKGVLERKKFRECNPTYQDGKPCVYVGHDIKDARTAVRAA